VTHLKRLDRYGKMEFINFREPDFAAKELPVSMQSLEKQIHAITPEGEIISRMDVIRKAYQLAGRGWMVAPTNWPLLRPLFDALYMLVASNRMFISRLFRD
jgi:predicted DCC family thiol-disulfide oxidoreductase YuxK